MPKYTVLVDTVEYHTRRYIHVEAGNEDDAKDLVHAGGLDYTETFDLDSFEVVEVTEEVEV